MNAELVATARKDHKVEGSQDTGVAHVTATEVPRIRPLCKVKAEVRTQDLHWRFRKTNTQGF